MELLFNDLSIHGQFHDLATFEQAIARVMSIRELARRYGRELQCHREVASASVMSDVPMQKAVQHLSRDGRTALMLWLTRHGPFWEDVRRHGGDDWLECNGGIVTDSAVGEAAYCLLHDVDCRVVSMEPSAWLSSPLEVDWHENESVKSVGVPNYWKVNKVQAALDEASVPSSTWDDVQRKAKQKYFNLTFLPDSFAPLQGHPFGKGAARNLLLRLAVLHELKSCSDEHGNRTAEGHELHRKHFTGDKAWFSDSSDTEKAAFRKELTFPHPEIAGAALFCTWHGKVEMPQLPLRIHFSMPDADGPLYVAYVGPKITRR